MQGGPVLGVTALIPQSNVGQVAVSKRFYHVFWALLGIIADRSTRPEHQIMLANAMGLKYSDGVRIVDQPTLPRYTLSV